MSNPNDSRNLQWINTTNPPSSPPTTGSTSGSSAGSQYQYPPYQTYPAYQQPPPTQHPAAYNPNPRPQALSSGGGSQQTQFHHYQPPPSSPRQGTTASRHLITAPFQVPRVGHPWPFAGASQRLQGGGGHEVPIDPRLLSGNSGGNDKGKSSGWPPSSGT